MKKIGIIGVGAIAQSYMLALDGADFAEIGAVADTNADAVATAAESFKCKGYASHKELAEKSECDAVVICTPPKSHVEIARDFLSRKIPVLCEKPLAIDTKGAEAIIAAAKENDVLVSMASKFRYVDDVIRTKSIISSGLLGDIRLLENAFTARIDMSHRWNSDRTMSGGGVAIDNGTHSVDIIRYLLGPIARIQMIASGSSPDLPVEDNALLLIETEAGAAARVDLSWSFEKQLPNYLNIFGTKGTIHVGWKESRYRQIGSSDWIVFGKGYDKIYAFRNQLRNFCAAIDGRESSLVSAEGALASVSAIQAAYQSVNERTWVDVAGEEATGSGRGRRVSSNAA